MAITISLLPEGVLSNAEREWLNMHGTQDIDWSLVIDRRTFEFTSLRFNNEQLATMFMIRWQ